MADTSVQRESQHTVLLWSGIIALLLIGGAWVAFTPSGLLGKADAVGYAVCHRIEVRSFMFPNGRTMPMCARCSGTFLGVFLGLFGPGLLLQRRRAGAFPKWPLMIALIAFSAWWAFDGTNSFMHLLPADLQLPRLYGPTNFLRLTTGTFHGITMGSLLLPIVNATLWSDVTNEPTIDKAWHLLVLMAGGVLIIVMVYTEWSIFLYPLSLLSAIGVVTMLASINTVVAASLLGRDNTAHSLRDVLPVALIGVAATILMIGVIDALRFAMFGTWGGFIIS